MKASRGVCPLDLCALTCVLVVLAQGVFLVVSRPAVRIILLASASVLSIAGIWFWSRKNSSIDEHVTDFSRRAFPIVFFILGVTYLLFFPPGSIPDEDYHYGMSNLYANLVDPNMSGAELRNEDIAFVTDRKLFSDLVTPSFWQAQRQGLPVFATHEGSSTSDQAKTVLKMEDSISIQGNPPHTKVFAALGVLLGRLLGLSGAYTFLLGRFFNFVPSFLLVVLAVRLTPIGRNAMMTAALLPMTLHLMGSYSYDAMIIGLAFLLSALIFRLLCMRGRASRALLFGSAVVAFLLAPCKMVYYVIGLLVIVVPAARFGSRREAIVWKACILLIPLAGVLLLYLGRIIAMSGVQRSSVPVNVRLGETGQFFTLGDIVAHPLSSATFFARTLYQNIEFYVSSLVGGNLGWFQVNIVARSTQVYLLLALLGFTTFLADDDDLVLAPKERILALLCVGAGVFGVFLSMWLGWTFTSEEVINGVQGRYFAPFLPLLLMGLRGRLVRVSADLGSIVTMAITGFNFIYLAQITYAVL